MSAASHAYNLPNDGSAAATSATLIPQQYQQQQQQQQYPNFHLMQYPQHYHYHPRNDEMLYSSLKNQIEYYFRPQNLEKDTYLLNHLRANNGVVPIHIICNFPKVRQLHAYYAFGIASNVPTHMTPHVNPQLLQVVLKGSDIAIVSDDCLWIRPKRQQDNNKVTVVGDDAVVTVGSKAESGTTNTNKDGPNTNNNGVSSVASTPSSPSSQASSFGVPTHPLPAKERNVVIIRDIPNSATADTIMDAFTVDSIVPKSARPDVGNTWYVTFESEDQAVSALSQTRDKTILDVPILGRLAAPSRSSFSTVGPPPMTPLPPPQESPPLMTGSGSGHKTKQHHVPVVTPVQQQPPQQQHHAMYMGSPMGYYPAAATPYYRYGVIPGLPPQQYNMHPAPYQVQQQQLFSHQQQQQRSYQQLQKQRQSQPYHQQHQHQQSLNMPRMSNQQQQQIPGDSAPPKHVYVPPKETTLTPNTGGAEKQPSNEIGAPKTAGSNVVASRNTNSNTKNRSDGNEKSVASNQRNDTGQKDVKTKSDKYDKTKNSDKDKDVPNSESSTAMQTKNNKKNKKKNRKKKSNNSEYNKTDKNGQKEAEKDVELSVDDFPALDGKTPKPSNVKKNENGPITGYAQALLKQPAPASAAPTTTTQQQEKRDDISSSPVKDEDLQKGMDKVAINP
jgi:hypothetical protein